MAYVAWFVAADLAICGAAIGLMWLASRRNPPAGTGGSPSKPRPVATPARGGAGPVMGGTTGYTLKQVAFNSASGSQILYCHACTPVDGKHGCDCPDAGGSVRASDIDQARAEFKMGDFAHAAQHLLAASGYTGMVDEDDDLHTEGGF